jgi:hypothetical protein
MWQFDMDLVFSGVGQINGKLAKILAMLRRTPFITMWNETVYGIVEHNTGIVDVQHKDIPILVNGYTLNTEPSLPDTVTLRIAFTVYNSKPLVEEWQFYRQGLNGKGEPVYDIPVSSIEHSNLWRQYTDGLIKSVDAGFMFAGELEDDGTRTDAARASEPATKNDDFISRNDPASSVLRNGDAVKPVGNDWGSANATESFHIGYHVTTIMEAFDLSIGAYKSRRSGRWVGSQKDLKEDLSAHLGIEIANTISASDLNNIILKNIDDLYDLPVMNVGNRYIKLYSIADNNTTTIDGITIRRQYPASILPIISAPVPTAQYLGGGSSDIMLSIVTSNEAIVKQLAAVDKSIETDARSKMRHAGSNLTYVSNDVVNLNGIFTVVNGTMDIQSVPENPGTFIVSWTFHEQTEVVKSLDSRFTDKRAFKKKLLTRILEFYGPRWDYNRSQKTDEDVRFTFDEINPSYTETILIPSMVRLVRNAFIRWLKEGEKWEIQKAISAASTLEKLALLHGTIAIAAAKTLYDTAAGMPDLRIDTLFGEYIGKDNPNAPMVVDPNRPNQGNMSAGDIASGYGKRVDTVNFSRRKAYNQIWKMMTGQSALTSHPLWAKFLVFMMLQAKKNPDFDYESLNAQNRGTEDSKDKNRRAFLLAGAVQTILYGDCRRFEMMIRSPHLLRWELGLLGIKTSREQVLPARGKVFTEYRSRFGLDFVLRADILSLFNSFKEEVNSSLGIDLEMISAWRPRDKTEELRADGTPAVDFENSSHTFGVGVDFSVIQNGVAISKSSISSAVWSQIGAIARKYFKWGGDFVDPVLAAKEVNHVMIKRYDKNMAAKLREEYRDYYYSGETLLQYGITNKGSSFTGDYLPQDIIDGSVYISCYTDLGIPFAYQLEDNDGNLLRNPNGSLKSPVLMTDPTFYMRSYSPFIGSSTHKDTKTIEENVSADASSLSRLTGASSICMAIERTVNYVSNEFHVIGKEEETATNSSDQNKQTINKTDAEKSIDKLKEAANKQARALRKQGLLKSSSPVNFGTFRSLNDLFLSNSLVKSMGAFGSETSPLVIAEAEYEHRMFRSSFKDFNVDIEKTIPDIVSEARNGILNNPKYFSMTRAYPTYKIYFREENSPEWFLFDNFYDYRSCESIRFYKEKASPSAVVHLSLNNHDGALTDLQARFAKESHAADRRNSEDRITSPFTNKAIKSLFLQPGTQIQIKMGYEANPADMPTIFNGFVTDVGGGEKFEIICQSYGAELFTEANVGSFLGWICPPKAFIWWMLLDSKVKHLGRLVQASILPSTVTDFIDGPAFDDNIYIDQELEPGTWRLLQSYNADNMTKWDALQDIAAAHPGYICQVVPYDDRETVFFGRPDDWYKYTQDLGVTRQYMKLSLDLIPDLGGGWRSLNKKAPNSNKSVREKFQEEMANDATPEAKKPEFNYLQWMKVKDRIDQAFAKWRANHAEGAKGRTMSLLMDYCKVVDVLNTIGSDGSTGNIQFQLGTEEPQKSERKSDTRDFGLNSKEESPGPIYAKKETDPYEAEIARLAKELIKSQPSDPLKSEMLDHLDPVVRSSILKSLSGRTIPLLDFYRDTDVQTVYATLSRAKIQTTGIDQKDVALFDNLQGVLSRYDLILDEKKVKEELKNLATDIPFIGDQADFDKSLLGPMKKIYKKYGIESPLAVICWFKLSSIWQLLLGTFLPGGDKKTTSTSSRNPMDLNQITDETKNKNSISFEGHIPFNFYVNHRVGEITIKKLDNGSISFSGPIFRTDLKTHTVFRNILLQNLVDISGEFQKVLAEFGHSPIEKRFRNYHIASGYEHIVDNKICSNFTGMWNQVKVKYKRHDFMDYYTPFLPQLIFGDKLNNEFQIQAGETLDDRVTRELTIPVENAKTVKQARNYATSILAEGVRNMYGGRLVLLGNPEIKPYDVIYIHDDYTKMYGPIEVKSVTHVMSAENGFVSIIEPHAYLDILSQGMGPASLIKEVFDVAMLALLVVPGIGQAGALAKGGQAGASILSKQAVNKAAAQAFKKGKTLGNQLYKFVGSKYKSIAKTFDVATKEAVSSRTLKFMADKKIDNAKYKIITEINKARSLKDASIPQISKLTEANGMEVNAALKNIMRAKPGSSLEAEIDWMIAKGNFAATAGVTGGMVANGSKGAAKVLINKESWAALTKVSFLNMMKTLAVGGPIAYYQMFAGIDDPNYACPLRITPLSLMGKPFHAGLDGITHRGGIWENMAGEWRRLSGSVNTVAGALEEFYSSITGMNL